MSDSSSAGTARQKDNTQVQVVSRTEEVKQKVQSAQRKTADLLNQYLRDRFEPWQAASFYPVSFGELEKEEGRSGVVHNVLQKELKEILQSRRIRLRNGSQPRNPTPNDRLASRREIDTVSQDLVGFAISGGGIRSATFNLGVLQGFAKYNLLRHIDYLSTISGGGYVGSWLTSWIRRSRDGIRAVEQHIGSVGTVEGKSGRFLEPNEIRFLRRFSNYLTPKTGLLTADTVTAVSIFVRNLLLNLALLISLAAIVLLLPRLAYWVWKPVPHEFFFPATVVLLRIAIFLLIAAALIASAYGIHAVSQHQSQYPRLIVANVKGLVIFPLAVSALVATYLFSSSKAYEGVSAGSWAWIGGVSYAAFWILGSLLGLRERGIPSTVLGGLRFGIFGLLAGSFGGLLILGITKIFQYWGGPNHTADNLREFSKIITLGPPLWLAAFILTGIVHVGLMGRSLPDAQREWFARASGLLTLLSLYWVSFCGLTYYGAIAVEIALFSRPAHNWQATTLKILAGGGWLVTTAAGLLAGGRDTHDPKAAPERVRALAKLAPIVFLAGLVLLLSYSVHITVDDKLAERYGPKVASTVESDDCKEESYKAMTAHCIAERHWASLQLLDTTAPSQQFMGLAWRPQSLLTIKIGSILVFISGLLWWRLDVNEFSMHHFYRNRLVRCYLGASNKDRTESSHPFTGFSYSDDIRLRDLRTSKSTLFDLPEFYEKSVLKGRDRRKRFRYVGPYHIIGTALNLVRGNDLSWQKRKATSFFFSPIFCGYDYFPGGKKLKPSDFAFRPTARFGGTEGPSLGTAMAISGAAASPNSGYHSSSPLAALMTIFNVRLGWWVGNPRHSNAWLKPGPRSAAYVLKELFTATNDKSWYVYLSDGGHFENLGLYELVRRKCRYIVISDGSRDQNSLFDDLGNAIEKCRRDFGVEISLLIDPLTRKKEHGDLRLSDSNFAVGTITYPENKTTGVLLYLKATITGKEPNDVLAYARTNSGFPHDYTSNQFFNESQFEAYRALGQFTAERAIASSSEEFSSIAELLENLRRPVANSSELGTMQKRAAASSA